ncbi:MAG: helix-turn-helix transcriptional regulator [Bacteroidetes bacterium]|nr:helix-turn-helix transcriptional regulator [Bacteroidota bacterium]
MASLDQMKFHRKLGAKILQARLDCGLEQNEVAAKIGKTQSYVSKVESGDIKIDLHTLTLMMKILKKPIGYFIAE